MAAGSKSGEKPILPTLGSAGVPVGLHPRECGVLEGEGGQVPFAHD